MNQDPVRVSQVYWTRVFPLLRLFQAASLGCGLPAFLLAYACLLVSWTGCSLANCVLSDGSITAVCEFPWQTYVRLQGDTGHSVDDPVLLTPPRLLPASVSSLGASASHTFFRGSFSALFGSASERRSVPWLLWLDLMIWNALVLGFFGTAIARSVATAFCTQTRLGVLRSLGYCGRHSRATLLASGLAVLFPGILFVMMWCAGLVARTGFIGEHAVNIVWGAVFVLGVSLALVYVVGGTAWLLSVSAIGTDGCSGADALSRCISYVLSHRLWTACGFLLVSTTALSVRWLVELILAAGNFALPEQLLESNPGVVRRIWMFMVELIPDALHLSVFLSGLTVLYILLRRKEDGISLDEIDGTQTSSPFPSGES